MARSLRRNLASRIAMQNFQYQSRSSARHTASVKEFDLAAGCPGRMLAIGDFQTETTPASAKTCVACHFRARVSSADYEEQTLRAGTWLFPRQASFSGSWRTEEDFS